MAVYEEVKRALQDFLVPELQALKVEIRRLDERIDGLEKRLDSAKAELLAEIRRVEGRLEALEREVRVAMEVRERLAALEAKVGITRQ